MPSNSLNLLNPHAQNSVDLNADVEMVNAIEAVPTILEVVCRTTGMGFAALARVTDERWIACSVLDQIAFGLKSGGELKVDTTICHEIRQTRDPVVIENVAEDALWCRHATPAMYGFQSYISVPVILKDGSFFGTLCAIDPRPASLKQSGALPMFRLFAELIATHIDARRKLAATQAALVEEREISELREQFIAVLGHDLRNPLRGVRSFSEMLLKGPLDARTQAIAGMIRDSALRMQSLIDNLLDLARGRLGGGLSLRRNPAESLEPMLRAVIAELSAGSPDRIIETNFSLREPVNCDTDRIAQLFSNLLSNALTHGTADEPVRVKATSDAEVFELSVANAGEPIPPAARERLFQPFYRSSLSGDHQGLGLGLYIAHEIATAHGGTLAVDSTSEETRFTLRIPGHLRAYSASASPHLSPAQRQPDPVSDGPSE